MSKTNLELLDEAIETARAISHDTPHNSKAHRHLEYAIGLLREAWIDLDGQKADTAEDVIEAIGRGYRITEALTRKVQS